MSAQIESLKRQNERLKEDLDRKRIKVSEASAELIAYCEKTDEPFHPKYDKANNPYKSKGPVCNIV